MLDGRVAIVTGAGRGIGRAHAQRLAAYGARVIVNDTGVAPDGAATDETPAEETVAAIRAAGGEAVAHCGDVSSLAVGEALVELALASWGRLDVVVNNAGIGRPRMLFNMSEAEWDDVVRVHLKGTFAISRAACRHWRGLAKRDGSAYGRLLNTSTGLLVAGGAGQSNYVAAKGGVSAFSEAAASEMAPYGVTVNAIMPAARTRLSAAGWRMERASGAYDDTDPRPIAELVCYLASPAAASISGQTFRVRGGSIALVDGWRFGAELQRNDRGYTAAELADEIPRLVERGPKPAARPPAGWRAGE
ncbi:MAG: SDR family NAD(P)-dependent oxidoreductase [Deltaproteobacteria bacterium]|nr:SDR family NAD(P)-dependent oxidoreductase [Deltaproteobacteria bacterium]